MCMISDLPKLVDLPNSDTSGFPFCTGLTGALTSLIPERCESKALLFSTKPELVAQFEFTEWTPDGHLRHSKFVGLREDNEATEVVRENKD
jgi:ATP-dependent DNA ligase